MAGEFHQFPDILQDYEKLGQEMDGLAPEVIFERLDPIVKNLYHIDRWFLNVIPRSANKQEGSASAIENSTAIEVEGPREKI